jgi:hypothetical protein
MTVTALAMMVAVALVTLNLDGRVLVSQVFARRLPHRAPEVQPQLMQEFASSY